MNLIFIKYISHVRILAIQCFLTFAVEINPYLVLNFLISTYIHNYMWLNLQKESSKHIQFYKRYEFEIIFYYIFCILLWMNFNPIAFRWKAMNCQLETGCVQKTHMCLTAFNNYLQQFSSSDPSVQCFIPSHTRCFWIQTPVSLHLKLGGVGQFFSSKWY